MGLVLNSSEQIKDSTFLSPSPNVIYNNLSPMDKTIVDIMTFIICLMKLDLYTVRYKDYEYLVLDHFYNITEKLEASFWDSMLKDENFNRRLQLILLTGCDLSAKVENLVEMYLTHLSDKSISLDDQQKKSLIETIEKQIQKNCTVFKIKKIANCFQAKADNFAVKTIKTPPDGSCGIHAIFGKCENGICSCADVKQVREKLGNDLEKVYTRETMPKNFRTILDNYAKDYEFLPSHFKFKEAVLIPYKKMREGYDKLTLEEQEKRIEEFVFNPIVRKAYLEHLKDPRNFLLQDELMAIAEYYGLRVLLIQDGWFNDADKVCCNIPEALDSNFQMQENDVFVRFVNGNHYERACVIHPKEVQQAIDYEVETYLHLQF